MGRSRLVNSLQQIYRSYLPRSYFYLKQLNGRWSENHATVAADRKSVTLSSPSTRQDVLSKSLPVVENTGRAHSPEQSLLRGLQTSVTAASNRPSHNSLSSRHSASLIPSVVGCEAFYCEQRCGMSSGAKDQRDKETISVTFVDKDGEETQIRVPIGMSMLEAAHENDIELEGACEGSLACSTCHVIFMEEEMYSKLPEPTDEENDMLDLAFGLTETSRLGCQVIAEKELDGLRLALPAATRNFAVDGHVPKPH